jgi:hypothetical protein
MLTVIWPLAFRRRGNRLLYVRARRPRLSTAAILSRAIVAWGATAAGCVADPHHRVRAVAVRSSGPALRRALISDAVLGAFRR